jgi:hypothetical protein
MEIGPNKWKSIRTDPNKWKSVRANGNRSEQMEIGPNNWKSVQMGIDPNKSNTRSIHYLPLRFRSELRAIHNTLNTTSVYYPTMGITVHYNDTPFQLPSSPDGPGVNSTYAQGTQRLVEQKLLSRQLLPLLSSLASSSSSAAAAGVVGSRYKLRFGDGYATIIHVIRSDTSNSTSRPDDDVIEANISLKPRDNLSDDEDRIDPSDWMPTTSQSLDGSSSDTLHVDLVVKKIGFAVAQQQQQRNGSGLLRGRLGNGNLVPMTQSPFPVDEKKINLLRVWEHPEFEGYVDSYTLDRWSSVSKDEEGVNGGGDRARAGSFGRGFPPSMSTTVSGQPTNGNISPTKSKNDGIGNINSSVNIANSSSTSKIKTPSTAPQMKIRGNDVVSSTAATTNQNPTKKTKRKKATTEQETETPPPSTKRGKQPGGVSSAPAPDTSSKEKKIPPPKRPLNGFMTFSAEVRPEIVAQFPELSITELVRVYICHLSTPFIRPQVYCDCR